MKNAKAIATHEQDRYAKSPAVTHNTFGKGNAFYVGTVLDNNGMEWLIEQVCKTADIQPISSNAHTGVEIFQRANESSSFLFVLNRDRENNYTHEADISSFSNSWNFAGAPKATDADF